MRKSPHSSAKPKPSMKKSVGFRQASEAFIPSSLKPKKLSIVIKKQSVRNSKTGRERIIKGVPLK